MKISKEMGNLEIAELLRAVAASYKLKNEEKYRFQIIAYERAADAVEHSSSELKDLWDEAKLEEVPGIGKSIAGHLQELFTKGNSKHFDRIMQGIPSQVFDLMVIPGIGVKKALKLVSNLNIGNNNPLLDIEKAAKENLIEKLEDFGKQSQEDILNALKEIKGKENRLLLPYAEEIAKEAINWLKKCIYVKNADVLGSLRRKVSTIGDIDIAISTENISKVIEYFLKYPKIQRVIEKGETTVSVILPSNVRLDLKVQKEDSYGSLLQHFTGSKHHNIALREYALKKKLSLSEYGIKRVGKKGIIKFENEKDFYNYLGLVWIAPELREGINEIEASDIKNSRLPNLVTIDDIKSDLQIHSDFDIQTSHDLGLSSMEDIVDKANLLGYEYIAFTEHNPSQKGHNINNIIELIKRKKYVIEQLNDTYVNSVKGSVTKVFNSLEIDILSDGRLPLNNQALDNLDLALVSIHSAFKLSKEQMTKRVLNALENKKVKILAHPTGRKLGYREGVELDWDKIFDFCLKNNKLIEINADPMRLDLPDFLVKEAIKKGIVLCMGTDSHHVDHMDNMVYAVSVARRGWAQRKDIINTKSLKEFENFINK